MIEHLRWSTVYMLLGMSASIITTLVVFELVLSRPELWHRILWGVDDD